MITEYKNITKAVDLGLKNIPSGFNLSQLFPEDRLLRLHPNWFVSNFTQDDSAFSADIKDYVTDNEFHLSGEFLFNEDQEKLLSITINQPIQLQIRFLNKKNTLHAQIASVESEPDAEDPLLLWIRAIKEYIRIYLKRTPVTLFFRTLMNKMVLKMDPSQRKICLMIAKITAVEVAVIFLLVIGYTFYVIRNIG